MAVLIEKSGDGNEIRYPLKNFPISIGRDERNDIVVKDEECSRFHIRMKQRGRLFIIEDLESRNGSYLNGDKFINAVIHNGDRIIIGSTEYRFMSSRSDIHIVEGMFDMQLPEGTGINGPIDFTKANAEPNLIQPIRLESKDLLRNASKDQANFKLLSNMYANIVIIEDFEEATKIILKYACQLIPHTLRAAAFVWAKPLRQLIPIATKQAGRKKDFNISRAALEDVVTRQKGLILHSDNEQHRVVLPMIRHKELILLFHFEISSREKNVDMKGVEKVTALFEQASSAFESLLLRRELDNWTVSMIETMISTVEAKDTYTRGHSERVSKYSMAIADKLKLDRDTKKMLMLSSICHDIGKIGIPDAILKKAAMLSVDEYNEMKLHPTIGADIMSNLPNSQRFLSGVKYHHERWDGTGYPEGLEGENIPFFGRIVAIADVFDAMVSGRSYSGFLDLDDAVEKISEEEDMFDPEIIKTFEKAYNDGSLTLKTDTKNQEVPKKKSPQ